jgi:hypothetical protein
MNLTKSQRFLLEVICRNSGKINWYQLGRSSLKYLDSPADFKLEPLLDAGYITEERIEGEPLPRLYITDAGREALEAES